MVTLVIILLLLVKLNWLLNIVICTNSPIFLHVNYMLNGKKLKALLRISTQPKRPAAYSKHCSYFTLVWFTGVSPYNQPFLDSKLTPGSLAVFEFNSHKFWSAKKLKVLHCRNLMQFIIQTSIGVDLYVAITAPPSLLCLLFSVNWASNLPHSGKRRISALESRWAVTTIAMYRVNLMKCINISQWEKDVL